MKYTVYKNYLGRYSIENKKCPLGSITSRVFRTHEEAQDVADYLNNKEGN